MFLTSPPTATMATMAGAGGGGRRWTIAIPTPAHIGTTPLSFLPFNFNRTFFILLDSDLLNKAIESTQGSSNHHPFRPPKPDDVATICYTSGTTRTPKDNLKLLDGMAELKPTVFCSVPRLYNRVYDRVMNAVKSSGGLREKLFNAAFNAKRQALLKGKNASPMWKV
ncbi:hypothetical protein LXL04_019001 [Taraxacum kok-saghyz]